jgi:predicted SprT family Zn-dependent metalloprotease
MTVLTRPVKAAFMIELKAKIALAEELFDVDFSGVKVELNIRGNRMAGQACSGGFTRRGKYKSKRIRYNPAAIMECYNEMVTRTLGHEIAHMVCMLRPELGKGHDAGWKRVDIALGGDGSRCHTMNFGTAINRTRKQYIYNTTSGQEVTISSVRHGRVQRGAVYTLRSDGSQIRADGLVRQQRVA